MPQPARYAIIQTEMDKIDEIDKQIVRLLGQDARQSSETLAKQLNISAATVRRRLRDLMRRDLLRIIGVVNPASFGFPLLAVISLDVVHDKVTSTIEELSKKPEVSIVSTITGRYDIMIIARFGSTKDLSEFVSKELVKLDGIKNSETFICLEVKKKSRIPLP